LGAVPPFCGELGPQSPCNTTWPGPRPTSNPSGMLILSTVWPEYTNVTERKDRTDRQDNGPIGYGQPFYKRSTKNSDSLSNVVDEVTYLSKRKGKEEYLYSAFWPRWYTQSAQAWITQFYLQITPCLPFIRERLPDVTTTATEAADIQLQPTTHLSTPKG